MCLLTLIYLNIGYLKALLIRTEPRLNKFVSYSAVDPTPLNSFDSFFKFIYHFITLNFVKPIFKMNEINSEPCFSRTFFFVNFGDCNFFDRKLKNIHLESGRSKTAGLQVVVHAFNN